MPEISPAGPSEVEPRAQNQDSDRLIGVCDARGMGWQVRGVQPLAWDVDDPPAPMFMPARNDPCSGCGEENAAQETHGDLRPASGTGFGAWWRRLTGRVQQPSSPVGRELVPSSEPPSDAEATPATLNVVEEQCSTSGSIADAPARLPSSSAKAKGVGGNAMLPPPRRAGADPVCLICLETLTSEEFRNGEAMTLDCQCRGDLALRHRECALKWARVKGDRVCELCKHEVRNLPAIPPRPPPPAPEDMLPGIDDGYAPPHMLDLAPSHADLVFDCVRVTWVAMIISILFFDMNLASALWTGLVAGLAYSCMVRLMYRQHFAAMQRLAEAQTSGAAANPRGPMHIPIVTVV